MILSLLGQSEFVAEQSSESVISFLRGERISNSERQALKSVADQLEKAMAAAESADIKKTFEVTMENEKQILNYESITRSEEFFRAAEFETALGDYSQLVPLVPLVKTAWAEGRITKRERQLIFEAAARMGVAPGTSAHERLAEWLELHPTEDFYLESLERLRTEWEKLPEDERVLRRLDVLSDCVNIAEASGGTSRYQAGGLRVCDEEIMAVTSIAQKLNSSPAPASV